MKTRLFSYTLLAATLLCLPSGFPQTKTPLRGWLTDEGCARGRANGDNYSGGNPDCARRCVAEGKRIVLALPEEKMLLVVANPEVAKDNVGNYVEVDGAVDADSIRIRSVKMLQEGVASCAAPKEK
jgi:hypothetical protein